MRGGFVYFFAPADTLKSLVFFGIGGFRNGGFSEKKTAIRWAAAKPRRQLMQEATPSANTAFWSGRGRCAACGRGAGRTFSGGLQRRSASKTIGSHTGLYLQGRTASPASGGTKRFGGPISQRSRRRHTRLPAAGLTFRRQRSGRCFWRTDWKTLRAKNAGSFCGVFGIDSSAAASGRR